MAESGTLRKGMTFYYYSFCVNTRVHPHVLHRLHCTAQQGSHLVTAEEGRSPPGAVMMGVTIPLSRLWGLLGLGFDEQLVASPFVCMALLTHTVHISQ